MQGDENLNESELDQTVVAGSGDELIGAEPAAADTNACSVCRQPLSKIFLNVDGSTLIMESCDGCDIRRWQLAGERIDLQRALEEVGEHVSRARS